MKSDDRPAIATVPADTLGQPRRVVAGALRWSRTLAAFRHRNYRLFFSGQIISLVGTWIQTVAEGWLVYQLTNSAFLLGLIRFLNTIPVTFLSIFGGALADRRSKRSILIATQIASMLLALTLAALVYWKVVAVWQVAVLGLLLGVANAFDIPARQAFVIEMVDRKSTRLNSSHSSVSRMPSSA